MKKILFGLWLKRFSKSSWSGFEEGNSIKPQSSFPVIHVHRVGNVGIFVLLQFWKLKVSCISFNSKQHHKCKFALKFIPLVTTSNLFSLKFAQKVHIATLVYGKTRMGDIFDPCAWQGQIVSVMILDLVRSKSSFVKHQGLDKRKLIFLSTRIVNPSLNDLQKLKFLIVS